LISRAPVVSVDTATGALPQEEKINDSVETAKKSERECFLRNGNDETDILAPFDKVWMV
jgi:hypothetical protein